MTIHSNKYFCYEIFKNIAIWSKNSKLLYNPCSFYNGYIKSSDKFDLAEIWNSDEHNRLKNSVKNDIPIAGCQSCYTQEKFGLVSRRIAAKNAHENFFQDKTIDLNKPTSIDYSVGNLCNLKCIICHPSNSSAWLPDWQKMHPAADLSCYKFDKFNQIEVNDTELLENIVNVHFHGGGEPLLSRNHVNLLKSIKQVKGLSDVRVYYNTNGTVTVSDEVLELWSECKLVELYFSIDDIDRRFNYQRTGANWEDLQQNLVWFQKHLPPNHLFKINCVWSYLNVFYLNELVDWYTTSFKTNRLGDSTELIFQKASGECSIDYASKHVIGVLLNKFKLYPELVGLVNTLAVDEHYTPDVFLNYIDKVDKIRNTSFHEICPEWAKLLVPFN